MRYDSCQLNPSNDNDSIHQADEAVCLDSYHYALLSGLE